MPKDLVGNTLGRQVLKSGTSIGANYAEAVHASSRRHFITLIEIATREARETLYWLDLLADSGTFPTEQLSDLQSECKELVAIFTASGRTAKKNQ